MQKNHWIGLAVVAIVAYFVGVYYPSIGTSAVSKVSSLGG